MKVNIENAIINKKIGVGDLVRIDFKHASSGVYVAVELAQIADDRVTLVALDGLGTQGALRKPNETLEECLNGKSSVVGYEVFKKNEYELTLKKVGR